MLTHTPLNSLCSRSRLLTRALRGSMRVSACAAVVACVGAADAQRYELALGGPNSDERAFDVEVVNNEGDYVTVGDFGAANVSDIHAARFDRFGTKIWDAVYRVPGIDVGYSVDVLANGDLAVAGWSAFDGSTDTVVMRLRPSGAIVWSFRYPGTAFSDPIHTAEVGPALEVGPEDSIFVTSHFQGSPVAMRIDANGSLNWANLYFYPFDDREVIPAYSDIKFDRESEQLVISGTVRIEGETSGVNFPRLQDPMLVRLQASDGAYVFATHANLSANSDIDDPEVGEGLDINPENGRIALAGESSAFVASGGPVVQLLTLSDPGLNTNVANLFGSPNADNVTGSAAVRYTRDGQEIGVAGAFAPFGGPATVSVFDLNGNGLFRRFSADQAVLDSIVEAPSCGWLGAGRIGGFLIGGIDDIFHLKTNDVGDTTCNQQAPFNEEFPEPVTLDLPLEPEPLEFFNEYDAVAIDPFDQEAGLCFSPWCLPCLVDFNNDGVVNILDVVAFINNWNAMGPGADFNMDGVINILDVVAFIQAWNNGCV